MTDDDTIFKCIKSFSNGASCGRDGLCAQHILYALYEEGFVVARYTLYVITLVANLWLGGRCPMSLAEFVAFAPLTLLLKPDGGIQPIIMGSI